MDTCIAKWKGGQCDRPKGEAKGLCSGHYGQQRRGQDFAPLLGAHGRKGEDALELISVRVRREDHTALEAEAKRRGVDAPEVYREAVSRHAARLRKSLDSSNSSDK